jgi:hypothetical protein
MHPTLTIQDVNHMTWEELRPYVTSSLRQMATAAAAAADGAMPRRTRQALESEEHIQGWVDGINWAAYELESAVERFGYERDHRHRITNHRLKALRALRHQALILLKHQDRDNYPDLGYRPGSLAVEELAKSLLSRHHGATNLSLKLDFVRDNGGDPDDPLWTLSLSDATALVEFANERGLIGPPTNDAVEKLRRSSDETFRAVVLRDIRHIDDPVMELRHPMLLNDWLAVLQDIESENAEQARYSISKGFADLDIKELWQCESHYVTRLFAARRFQRALLQRKAEWKRVHRTHLRTASTIIDKKMEMWRAASIAVREIQVQRHPDQYDAIRAYLRHYTTPDADTVDPDLAASIKKAVMAGLADGAWRSWQ